MPCLPVEFCQPRILAKPKLRGRSCSKLKDFQDRYVAPLYLQILVAPESPRSPSNWLQLVDFTISFGRRVTPNQLNMECSRIRLTCRACLVALSQEKGASHALGFAERQAALQRVVVHPGTSWQPSDCPLTQLNPSDQFFTAR